MLPRVFTQSLMLFLFSAAFTCDASDWISPETGVSFIIPTNSVWQQVKPPRKEAKLILEKTNGTATVFFAAFEVKHQETEMNKKLAQGWARGYFRESNATNISTEFFDFKGKHAYKINYEETVNGVNERGIVILWLDEGKVRDIVATKVEGDPLKDEVIKAFVDSATFLDPKKSLK